MESVPPVVQQLIKLLQSQPMFKLLRTMTGLEMADVPLSDDDDSSDEDDDDDEEEGKVMKSLGTFHSQSQTSAHMVWFSLFSLWMKS